MVPPECGTFRVSARRALSSSIHGLLTIEKKLQSGSFVPLSISAQKSLFQSASLNLSEAIDLR